MKKHLHLLFASLFAIGAYAGPAHPGTFTVTQKDGTVITLRIVGDEHFHYFVNVDNGQTMLRSDDGEFFAADEKVLAPMRAAAQQRRAMANERRTARLQARAEAAGLATTPEALLKGQHKMIAGEYNGAMKGKKKGLVILMEFPDLRFLPQNDRAAYDRVFNQEGYNEYGSIGSVHDYFHDQSYGEFDLTFDVVGPYTADNEMAYYGTNMPFPNDPYGWGVIQDLKACLLPMEAVKKADPDVNYKDYDWDGDGEVDQVYIIYPGYAESSGAPANTIWPHESSLSQWAQYNGNFGASIPTVATQRLDGVKIDTYAMSQELTGTSGSTRVGIGTACHEFAHCLGFPDFYDINQRAFGMESFDIMDNGGYNGPTMNCEVPAGFTAYERWMSGWLEPTVLSEGCAVKDMVAICDKPEAYVIYNEGNHNEYLLLENRQPKGWHKYVRSWSIPGGMLVSHIDFDKTAWRDNKVNTDGSHQRNTLVPAGKTFGTQAMGYLYTYESDYRSMLYPGSKNVTELTDQSHYSCGMKLFNRNTDGSYNFGAPIHNIEADAARGTISFVFKDGPDDGNRWTVNFVAGGGKVDSPSWTQSKQNESLALPTATIDLEGWHFLGWATELQEETTARPEGLLEAGTIFQPTSDATFYAVYGYSTTTGGAADYRLVDGFRSGADYVLCNKGAETDVTIYAFNALSLLENNTMRTPAGKAIEVDFSGDVPMIHEPAASLIWHANLTEQGITLDHDGVYLGITASGFSYTSAPAYLGWHSNYGLYGTAGGADYFAHISSGKFSVSTVKQPTSRLFTYELAKAGDNATNFATFPTGVPEGIIHLSATTSSSHDAVIYDLQGRRVNGTAPRGIFLQNGKKVMK